MNRTDLAKVFGTAPIQIDRFISKGMPFVENPDKTRKSVKEFDTAECIDWRMKDAVFKAVGEIGGDTEAEAKRRERVAMADLREMQVAERRKEMIRVDDVVEEVEGQLSIVKSRLQAIPSRIAQAVSIVDDAAEIERLMAVEINDALTDISKWSSGDDAEADGNIEAVSGGGDDKEDVVADTG